MKPLPSLAPAVALLALGLSLSACGDSKDAAAVDTDGDGISDADEAALGTDPNAADSDADGLDDGAEVDLGTDPLSADSDGDGYLDGWEVTEGTDPVSADSRIYTGNWPYNPDKAGYAAGDWGSFTGRTGDVLPATVLVDQYGEPVDLYDFAGQGKYIVIDISAMWCGPCNGLASWLTGGDDSYGFDGVWPGVADLVDAQAVYWITVLVQDEYGNVPELDDIQRWEAEYDDSYVPILADQDLFYNVADAFPDMLLFDQDMNLVQGPTNVNHYKPMDVLDGMSTELLSTAE